MTEPHFVLPNVGRYARYVLIIPMQGMKQLPILTLPSIMPSLYSPTYSWATLSP